jgi:hypothetical protein
VTDDEIVVCPEISQDFTAFEEFCSENLGRESMYLEVVATNPLKMDPVTLAFSIKRFVRLSDELLDIILLGLDGEKELSLESILDKKGIQLDKSQAGSIRNIIFSFRDCEEEETRSGLVRALQLLTISRERRRVVLTLEESYNPPYEGWTAEDFGGDDLALDQVRSIEDPRWLIGEEEN